LNSGAFDDLPASGSALGSGWTHNYGLSLDFSGANGPANTVVLKAAHGTPLYFEIIRDTYRAAPGVRATLTRTEVITGQYIYTVTAANQTSYVFTDSGQLTSQVDQQGNTINFEYNSEGLLAQISEPVSGRYLDLGYDAEGLLLSVTDSGARTTSFGYEEVVGKGGEPLSLLRVVTDTRGYAWTYGYTQLSGGQYLLSSVTDPTGRLVEETGFDAEGRAITQTYRGAPLTLEYHPDGQHIVTEGGQVVTHTYNSQLLLVGTTDAQGNSETFDVDEHSNRTSSRDKNGHTTSYGYDALGQRTVITDALAHPTHYQYDDLGRVVTTTDAKGKMTVNQYDPAGNLVKVTENYQANQPQNYQNEYNLVTQYGYDGAGRRLTTTDTLGRVSRSEYDAAGRLVRTIQNEHPTETTQNYQDEYNLYTAYGYDQFGRQVVVTDTLGRESWTFYDDLGRVE
jgi:YD repeat-containing protein